MVSSRSTVQTSRFHQCESLYAQGRIYDVAVSLLEMAINVNEDVRTDKLILDWLPGEFRRRALG